MADRKLSASTAITGANVAPATDYFMVLDVSDTTDAASGTNKKILGQELIAATGVTATVTELNYVDGVTSAIQTQIDGKAATSHVHSAADITSGTLAVARGGTGTSTAFTSGQVVVAGGSGVYAGSAGLTYASDILQVYSSGSDARLRAHNDSATGTATVSIYQPTLGVSTGYVNYQLYGSAAAGTYGGITKAGLYVQENGGAVTGYYIGLATAQKWYVRNGSTILLQQHGNSGLGVKVAPHGTNGLDVAAGVAVGSTFGGQLAPTDGLVVEGSLGVGIRASLDGQLHVYSATSSTKQTIECNATAGQAIQTLYNPAGGSGTNYVSHVVNGDTVGGTFVGISKNNAYYVDMGAAIVNFIENCNGPMTRSIGGTVIQTVTSTGVTQRSKQRVDTTASSATPTINTDTTDLFTITALAAAVTSFTTNLSGTPTNGQKLWIAITDNGTARGLTWGASFENGLATLPTTTVISTRLDVGFIWNSATSKWRCMLAG